MTMAPYLLEAKYISPKVITPYITSIINLFIIFHTSLKFAGLDLSFQRDTDLIIRV